MNGPWELLRLQDDIKKSDNKIGYMKFQFRKNIFPIIGTLFLVLFMCNAAPAGQVVLFDQSHGQRFLVEKGRALDLSRFADLFADNGMVIKTTTHQLSAQRLESVDILVISGAFSPITRQEINAIEKFLERGGKLVVMAHIHQPLFALFEGLGVSISKGPIIEQQNIIGSNPKDFSIVDIVEHPITNNIQSFNVYGGWGVINLSENVKAIARTSNKAWIDLDRNRKLSRNDAMQSFPVLLVGSVGRGRFAVFGDDAIFQNGFLEGGNLQLARNLVNWLCCQEVSI